MFSKNILYLELLMNKNYLTRFQINNNPGKKAEINQRVLDKNL